MSPSLTEIKQSYTWWHAQGSGTRNGGHGMGVIKPQKCCTGCSALAKGSTILFELKVKDDSKLSSSLSTFGCSTSPWALSCGQM